MDYPSTIEHLGPFDSRPSLRTYSIMTLCFPIQNFDRSHVESTLELACETLTKSIPYLAGQVKRDPDESGEHFKSGLYHIGLNEHPNGSILRIRHLPEDYPSYDEIRQAKAPSAMLDGSVLSSEKGLPDHQTDSEKSPVLVVQANFIPGGMLLSFSGMHTAMDGNGLGQIIRMFAAACRGECIAEADIKAAHLDRPTSVPPLKPHEPPLEHLDLRRDPSASKPEPPVETPPTLWTYFRFTPPKLAKLKAEASKDCPPDTWITNNDAVSALLWKATTKARRSHLDKSQTTLLRAINGRRILVPPLPDAFLGNAVQSILIASPIKELTDHMSISTITILIRSSMAKINDLFIRSLATLLRNEPDQRKIGYDLNKTDGDFVISSWADLPVYAAGGFGPLLGMPEFVRRPRLTPCEGLAYLMPKDPEGNMDVAVALREGDLDELKKDEEWMGYAEFIG